ncbi:MAG: fused MFS/spermidine synthase [Bacteroidota bacterium]
MKKQTLYGIIALLFIISGATGLMYQVVWFKYLSLFLGNTTYAQTVVLATFMGGLAIGAALWGRRADTSKRPLFLYAVLEIVIGVYCLFYPTLLDWCKSAFTSVVISLQLQSDSTEVLMLKLVVSLLTLLFPTILMGGTLPILVRFISERIEDAGRNVATLYFLNSFGAVVGSLLAGFSLIPLVGLSVTVYSAAVTNILIGFVSLILVWMGQRLPVGETLPRKEADTRIDPPAEVDQVLYSFSSRQVTMALVVAGLSGLTSMIYEVTWVRLMIPVLGSSTYSYSLMVVAFISGITVGSWLVSALFGKIRNLFGFLALCQLGVGLSMALTLPLYGMIPYIFWQVGHMLSRTTGAYPFYLGSQFLFSFLIMFIPTIFLGMTLPVASRIAIRNMAVLGRSVGNVFSVNTMGTVIGSLAAGLLLIPTIGVRHAMEVAMVVNIVLAAGVVALDTDARVRRRLAILIPCGIIILGYFSLSADWNRSVMLSGTFRNIARNVDPPSSYAEFKQTTERVKVLYYKEGTSMTVGVVEGRGALGEQKILMLNGKADASSKVDLPTQVLLGQIPMLLHPHAETALVIGYGSGVTVGSILTHPVKKVECVEISSEVIEASVHFEEVNNKPLQDPRVRIVIDDALSFLNLTLGRYDVIVSEPSNPWIAGIGNLYTLEFLRECRNRLRPGGLMVQWVQLYETNDEIFKMIARTFQSVFPNVSVWQSLVGDVLLVGSMDPQVPDEQLLQRKLSEDPVRLDLKRIDVTDVATVYSLRMLSQERLREYAGLGPMNTEQLPLLEYWAPRALFMNEGSTQLHRFDERTSFGAVPSWLGKYSLSQGLTDTERLNVGLFHSESTRGNRVLAYAMLAEYVRSHPDDFRALWELASLCGQLNRGQEQLQHQRRLAELRPDDPEMISAYAWQKFSFERAVASSVGGLDIRVSEQLFKRSIALTGDSMYYHRAKLGDLYYNAGLYAQAAEEYRAVLKMQNTSAEDRRIRQDLMLYQLARSLTYTGDYKRALGYAVQSTMFNPKLEEARSLVYTLWMRGMQPPVQ